MWRMDMYAKLSRALMRRKYEKVDRSTTRSARNSLGFVVKRKSITVKLPKAEKGQKKKRVDAASEPLPIVNPRLFTILSSANDVVDEAWLIAALRRALDEGRLNILMKENPSHHHQALQACEQAACRMARTLALSESSKASISNNFQSSEENIW